jgi:hypothetical protein
MLDIGPLEFDHFSFIYFSPFFFIVGDFLDFIFQSSVLDRILWKPSRFLLHGIHALYNPLSMNGTCESDGMLFPD